mgnify:CR=1 FL=1
MYLKRKIDAFLEPASKTKTIFSYAFVFVKNSSSEMLELASIFIQSSSLSKVKL